MALFWEPIQRKQAQRRPSARFDASLTLVSNSKNNVLIGYVDETPNALYVKELSLFCLPLPSLLILQP